MSKYICVYRDQQELQAIVIPTDEIFSNMAKNIGYRSAKIKVARKLGTSSQQYNKVDNPHLLRESLVYLKK